MDFYIFAPFKRVLFMDRVFKKYGFCFVLFLSFLFFHSCKTDEFKFSEITIKEDFGIKIITPLFTGKDKQGHIMEFRDFIHDWKQSYSNNSGPYTVLQYSNNSFKTIPTSLIFDPSIIIDSLEFLVQGSYTLYNIELVFTVTNSCPFPLNLQLKFLVKNSQNNFISPVSPPSFGEADFAQIPVIPVTTVHTMKLDSLQIENFRNSRNIELTSWFEQHNFINQNDTLSAHYPIDLSIVMIGEVRAK